ncbi:TetR/AcrR family transcriptional regulator [Variovorax sp. V512]|uniref:TetR/AcrR family transcriptional regulator n=1 Tax=Variovorax sp. V512 TaxID=3064160 RepID=UPI0034E86FD1
MALQQAFVQLLTERPYEAITIREIVALAGTALGSFYVYFRDKDDLARVCLHMRTKSLREVMREALARWGGRNLRVIVRETIDALLDACLEHPAEWALHFLLERHLSPLSAYKKSHLQFSMDWMALINSSRDAPLSVRTPNVASACHTLLHGLISHACLINASDGSSAALLSQQAHSAIWSFLKANWLVEPSAKPPQASAATKSRPAH